MTDLSLGWLNTGLRDFEQLLGEGDLKDMPVDLDTFLFDPYYLGNLKIKSISDVQRQIIEGISQVYRRETIVEAFGEAEAERLYALTVNEIIAMCGKGSGKDFCSRVAFCYAIYKLHCLRDPIDYYGKAHGTYIDMLNIAVNADQAHNVFFGPLKNMLGMSPFFKDVGFEPRKKEVEFMSCPVRLFSGNSEAEAWEGLDLMLVVLDEIAAFKGLINSSPVLTANGWVRNGDLVVGDKVVGRDGEPTEVVGVFPMGEKEVFEVEFEDGAKVLCSDDHIWNVREYSDGRRLSYKNLQLKDFKSIKLNGKWNQNRYSVPVVEPVEFNSLGELPIDPYVMGILISDGSLINSATFSSGDEFVVDEVSNRSKLVSSYGGVNYAIPGSNDNLRSLNLLGVRAETKFIPEIYLRASVEDRKLLLQGLMDGDGTPARGHGSYTTVSDRLKDDIIELCRSLGGIPTASKHNALYKDENGKKVECQDKWMICPRVPFNPFKLPRKAQQYKPHKRTLWRSIVGVKSLGYEEEMTCIKVANDDGLYVVNDYVVTHNTDTAFQKSNAGGAQRLSASAIYRMSKASVISRFPELGKVVLLSFTRYRGDFIMQRYEESAFETHVLRIKARTYEMNPMITREMLEPEYRRNPIDAKARYECDPPEMENAYFRDVDRVRKSFRGEWGIEFKDTDMERAKLFEDHDLWPITESGVLKEWFKCEDEFMRYIHVDLGLKRDRAALCMVHSPGTRKIETSYGRYEPLPVVKMDLIRYWEAGPGQEIDFAAIREFISLLAKKFPVGLVTFDRWQSVDSIQILNKRGIRCDTKSVKTNDYDALSTCFMDGRFTGYFVEELVERELLKLQLLENGKVDHPDGMHDDGAQALAAAVSMACEFADFDQDIEISVLGEDDDWEALELQDALEDDIRAEGRRAQRVELTEEDAIDLGFQTI